jgi:uncharacterized cupredoxin-like copper-binding protein
MNRTIQILTFILAALALAGCGAGAGPGTAFTIQETDFAYNPLTITVPAGRPVTLTFENTGVVEHDFVIERIDVTDVHKSDSETHGTSGHDMGDMQYDLHVSTLPGETSTVEFTVAEAGTYQFICTVKGHKEAGMIGTLIVVSE